MAGAACHPPKGAGIVLRMAYWRLPGRRHLSSPAARLPSGDHVETGERKTILIAEDEDTLRELVRVSLGPGYAYREAVDGVEALDMLRALRPDLLVLDLMLPRIAGAEVLADLRADPAIGDTPVVVITAWSHAQDSALAAGADRFVAKPFDPEDLKAVVDDLLEDG